MNTIFLSYKVARNLLSTVCLFATLLFFTPASIAQTNSYVKVGQSLLNCTRGDDACPANDLTVLDLFVGNADQCTTCTPGQTVTAPLTMRIDNTTGSVRTSFALFGTLSNGASIKVGNTTVSGNVFICVGPIDITKGINSFEVGTITFTCGTAVTLTNNYLAYTPANGTTQSICDVLSNAKTCQDIRPKCGVAASITIRTPVTGVAQTIAEPCTGSTTGGSIKVTPTGGVGPYSIDIFQKGTSACASTAPAKTTANGYVTTLTVTAPATSATTTATLAPGDYCIYVNDSKGCEKLVTHTIAGRPCCVNPAKPAVCEMPQSNLCPDVQNGVTIKVSGLQANAFYVVKQSGETDKIQQAPATVTSSTTLTFTGLVSGKGLTVYGEDRSSTPFCRGTEATCADITVCSVTAARITEVETQDIKIPATETKVKAMPNPFNDRIKFRLESAVSGQGSLDLYNMLGQKVTNVYKGFVEKGRVQNIEYSVPNLQRANLIYMFRVGNQQSTGKLIQLK